MKCRIIKISVVFLLTLSLLLAVCEPALAASDFRNATLDGAATYAELVVALSSATGKTECAGSGSICSVSVSFKYYYTDASGAPHITTAYNSAANVSSAIANAGGFMGSNIRAIDGNSTHTVQYHGQNWSTSINVIYK